MERLRRSGYREDERGIFRSGQEGYWSNLDKEENRRFLESLDRLAPREAIRTSYPQYEGIIFSPKRDAALELLDIKPGETGVDYGCMWGALSVGMSRRGAAVLAMDQTYESLVFLAHRVKDEGLDDIVLAQSDIRQAPLEELADFAVVNGVLEWIPEAGEVELKKFFGKKAGRAAPRRAPEEMQLRFLEQVCRNMKAGGRLLLTIENRYDYSQFIGKRDPHANLWLTSVLPRPLANLISQAALGRPYVNYLYSFPALKNLLLKAGFSRAELYMCFPDYRFPELILPYEGGISGYVPHGPSLAQASWRRKAAVAFERMAMRWLKARFFAPSIAAVAIR